MSRRRSWPYLAPLMPHFSRLPVLLCQEQEDFITHFIDAASITDVAEKFLARASLRLLYSKCRHAEGLPSLESPPAVPPLEPAGAAQDRGGRPHPRFPRRGKKAGQQSSAQRKRESALITRRSSWTANVFSSARLLALSHKMLAEKVLKWLPWRFRLSSKSQEDNLLVRPRKQARFQN